MNRNGWRAVRLVAGVGAQALVTTLTATGCPAPAGPPAERPAAHRDGPVRRGDLCATAGQAGTAQPGMRAVTCGRWRGLEHLTWGP